MKPLIIEQVNLCKCHLFFVAKMCISWAGCFLQSKSILDPFSSITDLWSHWSVGKKENDDCFDCLYRCVQGNIQRCMHSLSKQILDFFFFYNWYVNLLVYLNAKRQLKYWLVLLLCIETAKHSFVHAFILTHSSHGDILIQSN